MTNNIDNTSIEDVRVVVYAGNQIMSIGTEGDCLSFVEGAKEIYPYIVDWKVLTVEDYGELMYDTGYDTGYNSGVDEGESR